MGLALLAATLLLAPAPATAKLRPVGHPRAQRVSVHALTLAWRDRSRGERAYRIVAVPEGGAKRVRYTRAGSVRFRVAGLPRGTVIAYAIAPCRRRRGGCGPQRHGRPAATLLAPFGGPHPALGCEVFPGSDPFNERVDGMPLAARSHQIVAAILGGGDVHLHPDFGSNPSYGIPYAVVPYAQPRAPVRFTAYGDESDRGPYPIPPGTPIEGAAGADGDRHVLVVRRPRRPGGACTDYELYRAFERGGGWRAGAGAVFHLGAPLTGQRPAGWTSADAAGLPIFPGLVTYEQAASGEIDHAIRITFERTRRAYYPPATHYASDSCDANLPAMGTRLRLRSGYDLSGITGPARAIAIALERYGAIVADNGSDFYISGSTDRRWNDANLNQLKSIPGSAFEVVKPESPPVTDC